jgi:hypothetical protein
LVEEAEGNVGLKQTLDEVQLGVVLQTLEVQGVVVNGVDANPSV